MKETDNSMAIYRRLLRYSLQHRLIFALGVMGMVAIAGVDTSIAWLVKPFMDEGFIEGDPQIIARAPFVLIGLFVLRGVSSYVGQYSLAWVSRTTVMTLRAQIFDKLLELPTSYYLTQTSAELLNKLTYRVETLALTTTTALTGLVKNSLTLLGLVAVMFVLNWRMTLVVLVGGPLIVLIVGQVNRKFRDYARRVQQNVGDVAHVAEETIGGERVVKVYGGQAYERGHFAVVNQENRRLALKSARLAQLSSPLIQIIASSAIAMVIYFATHPEYGMAMSPGTFVAFFAAIMGIMSPLRSISGTLVAIQNGIAAAANVFDFLSTETEDPGGKHVCTRAQGNLRFEDLHFRYPKAEADALQGVDLDIKAGQMVAIVGRSGGGKSTLLSLLPRFDDPQRGRILLDGHDLRDYPRADLRRQLALVDQNLVLFDDTIRRNIAYGELADSSDAAVTEAARRAHALEFIEKLPQGLDSVIGQHGLMLSGGQRQRIALARAFLKDAPVLILDEATSALDNESERLIQQALQELMQGRTTLVIAHRLSTILHADSIVVMDAGRVVESGTHAELLARQGAYAALYQSAASATTDGDGHGSH